ncbi:SRPBCC family protein [Thermocrispum municipale]|uniref:SRPBCC family protein n=1 Tax=Thermocrispum municipale TaxID=37926 RepID=UPI0004112F5A|nr:SRPBCC family protein [Thermocrispum municipale]
MIALQHQFRVQLPVEQAWELLTDLPKVATCLPGAQLDDVVDGTYHGKVSARIGPVNANYQGVAYFRERDDVAHRAVVEARGKEAKGAGIASAVITMQLTADGSATRVDVATDLSVSGRAAQFGRSLLAEVSNTLVDDFVRRLESMIAGGEQPQPSTPQAERSAVPAAEQASLDVLSTLAGPLGKRAATPLVAAVIGGLVGFLLGHRRRPSPTVAYLVPYDPRITSG